LVQALGQCFGAIDLVLHPERGYVFLEINPNGQWGWIEEFTGLPISAAFAELLVQLAVGHASARTQTA
jgi:glutathione synthase/RimK-type ligase-like ATP-grasp enzyme